MLYTVWMSRRHYTALRHDNLDDPNGPVRRMMRPLAEALTRLPLDLIVGQLTTTVILPGRGSSEDSASSPDE